MGNRTYLEITLDEDSQVLNEVVVTALGIKRERKALGYGVDEVKGEVLTKAKETNVINSLAGRVPGLVVSQTAGGPSGSTRVILRGSTEMTGNNQPLYVVDGVPLDNTNYGSVGTYGGYDLGDGISSINPDDIESMSVLKGPAASALYGSRASHGVILITTKRANAKEHFSLEYNGTLTVDTQLAKWDDVQQIYGMGSNGTYTYDAVSNTNKSWGPKADGSNMLRYFDGVERPYLIRPDNTSGFFRTGLTATNSVIIGATSNKTGVRFTYTNLSNRDIVPNTDMSRNTFNLRTNTSISKVDLDFGVTYTREDVKNRPALGDSKANIGKNLMTLATTYDQAWLRNYEDANGEYANWNGMDPYNVNPYWDIYKNSNNSGKDSFRLNGKAVWNIGKHVKLQGTLGTEFNWFEFEDFKAPTTPGYEAGYFQRSKFDNRMYNFEFLALYNNSWGDFDLNATLGNFYEQPKNDNAEMDELLERIASLESELESEKGRTSSMDEQVALMEKSYELAAKYMGGQNGGKPEQAAEPSTVQKGKKNTATPVRQVTRQIVSFLAQPMSNAEFVATFSQERNRGFNTAVGTTEVSDRNTIPACVHGAQSVTDGQTVRLRLLEPMAVAGRTIPRNAVVVGTGKIQGERLDIEITSLEYDGTIIPVELAVYDTDGQPGIFIPNSMEMNAVREVAANMGGSLGSSINISTNAGAQLASDLGKGLIQGTSQYIAKKMRTVKVHLKAGYRVMLYQEKD